MGSDLIARPVPGSTRTRSSLLANLPTPKLIFSERLAGCSVSLRVWQSTLSLDKRLWPTVAPRSRWVMMLPHCSSKQFKRLRPTPKSFPSGRPSAKNMMGVLMGFALGSVASTGFVGKRTLGNLCPWPNGERLAVFTPYKEFQRDIPHYGRAEASWVEFAVKTFETMPPRHHGTADRGFAR